MDGWERILIPPSMEIKEAIEIIDTYSTQIAIVVGDDNKLLGTVTDGDIRRGILAGVPLNQPIEKIMNARPVAIPKTEDKSYILNILKLNKLRHLPVVDNKGRIIDVERLDDLIEYPDVGIRHENWVVILAGGLGKRLRPLTDDCPKPMLRIGKKPVLETILQQFILQGYTKFCFSVNFQAEKIENYFEDGKKWGAYIQYIHEESFMGTAGSLSLFSQKTDKPIIIINGDILTKLSFGQLVDFHLNHKAQATIAVAAYDYQVPYGVVKINKDQLIGFEEKPVFESFINAGVYIFNPEVLNHIPPNSYFDMNRLLETLLENDEKVCIFPIREYWIDIGKIEDFNKAKTDYNHYFN